MRKKEVLTKKEKEEIKGIIEAHELIEKEAVLSWDGSNLFLRVPREIADYLELKEEDRFNKSILLSIKGYPDGKTEQTFRVIKRRRKIRKKKNANKTTNKKR